MWQRIDERVSAGGTAVAVDLDLSLIHVRMPNLELRTTDIVAGPVERGAFDLVTARAVLHHVANTQAAIANMIAGLGVDGALLLIEPDFLPVSVAEPPEVRAFWDGWLTWSCERGIDYHIGRSTCASTGVAWPNKHQWHSGNRGLQRGLIVGEILD